MIGYGVTSFVSAPLNKYTTNARQNWSVQRAMTFVSGSYQVGAILGPVLGGRIGQSEGFSTVFRYAAILLLVSTLVMLFTRKVESPDDQEVTPRLSPLANPRFLGLLVIFFFSTFSLSMPQQLSSLYLQEVHHLSLEQIGLTGTLAGVGTAVIMFACGGLKPPLGVITGQLFLGLFCFMLWQGQVPAVFYAGYLFIGGYRLYRSMAMASVRPLVKSGDLGLAYGLVETGNAAAVTLAPLAAGLLYNYQAGSIFSVGLAALVLMMAVNAFFLLRKPVTP
jgi:predicted MFS family arabinose efflux permease